MWHESFFFDACTVSEYTHPKSGQQPSQKEEQFFIALFPSQREAKVYWSEFLTCFHGPHSI